MDHVVPSVVLKRPSALVCAPTGNVSRAPFLCSEQSSTAACRSQRRTDRRASRRKATSLIFVASVFLSLLLFLFALPFFSSLQKMPTWAVCFVSASIRRYEQTIVFANTTSNARPQWAAYDEQPATQGNYSKMASQADDLRVYDPVNFCIPFFQLDNVQLYISPNGFLGLSPYDRCGVFCYSPNPPFGGYGFTAQNPSGGDFPIIGLYVTDLNPRASPSGSGIFTWLGDKNYTTAATVHTTNGPGTGTSLRNTTLRVAIVEWFNIAPYGRSDGVLRGQIELWQNGTIIFRYKEVPISEVSYEQQTFPAGTGILWTKSQRAVLRQKLRREDLSLDIAAIRYEPVPDPCSVYTDCASCVLGKSQLCVWCNTTGECVGSDIADDVCGVSARNQCVYPSLNTSDLIPQAFYTTKIERGVAFESIASHEDAQRVSTAVLPARVSLGFDFPYFSAGPPPPQLPNTSASELSAENRSIKLASSGATVREVTIGSDLTLNVTGKNQRCLRQGMSAYIYSTNEYFRSVGGQCKDGDYVSSIVAYGTSLSFMQALRIYTLQLPQRPLGSVLCKDPSVLGMDGGGECPQAFVFQVTSANIYAHVSNVRITFQIILAADGSVRIEYENLINENEYFRPYETRCKANMPWNQYYTPYVGLFRDGNVNTDASSVTIPWTLLSANSRLLVTPVTECPDCLGRGYCDRDARRCVCKENFDGAQCEECAKGFYGPLCTPCESCANGGKCVDGLSGSGFCDCPPPFSGANCTQRCETKHTRCEGGCGMGFCSCGVCQCPEQTGYFGERCDKWVDPCRRYSLDGCAVCVSASTDSPTQCEWCSSTDMCVASWQQKFPLPSNLTRPTCLSRITADRKQMCTIPTLRLPPQSNFALITVIVIFACVALCAVIVLAAVCFCRRRPYNPLVLGAVVGVPNFTFPRREREIIGISRLPIQGKRGRPVQGIPLKQIPFSELVKFQRKERERCVSGGFSSLVTNEVTRGGESANEQVASRYISDTVDWGQGL